MRAEALRERPAPSDFLTRLTDDRLAISHSDSPTAVRIARVCVLPCTAGRRLRLGFLTAMYAKSSRFEKHCSAYGGFGRRVCFDQSSAIVDQ